MRKVLIATVVAAALFAVGAFAASFAVSSEDIASGADTVSACATNVKVDFKVGAFSPTPAPGDWPIDSVDLTFTGNTLCKDSKPLVRISKTGNPSFIEVTATTAVSAGGTVSIPVSGLNASQVDGSAAVLVDGFTITP